MHSSTEKLLNTHCVQPFDRGGQPAISVKDPKSTTVVWAIFLLTDDIPQAHDQLSGCSATDRSHVAQTI